MASRGELGRTKRSLHLSLTTSSLDDLGCLQKDLAPSAMEMLPCLALKLAQLKGKIRQEEEALQDRTKRTSRAAMMHGLQPPSTHADLQNEGRFFSSAFPPSKPHTFLSWLTLTWKHKGGSSKKCGFFLAKLTHYNVTTLIPSLPGVKRTPVF